MQLIFSREFPFLLCEIWGKSYNVFLGHRPKTYPRNIFVIKNALISDYRNPGLIKELQNLFFLRIKNNRMYLSEIFAEWQNDYTQLNHYWSRDKLTRLELKKFTLLLSAFWPAIFASMYIPLDMRFSAADRKRMLRLRGEIGEVADKSTHIIVKSLKYIFPRLEGLVNFVSIADLNRNKINSEKLRRISSRELIMMDNKTVSMDGFNHLKKRYNFALQKINPKFKSSFTGQIAYKGLVTGRVRIIQKRAQISSLTKGEVLVSSMTVPDFIPAMRRASSFVTDEGGITCHAAIVAREMKKPCIIGTRVATKVLKDGDMVEVDANKGVVKVIKRAARK